MKGMVVKKEKGVPRPVTVVVPGRRAGSDICKDARSLLVHLLSEKRKSWQSTAGWMCHSVIDSEGWRNRKK